VSEVVVRDAPLPPAEITHPAEAELEIRRHQALLDVQRRGRAELRAQVVTLRKIVEYALRGADLVDELRDAGQLADHGGDRSTSEVRTLNDVGLTRQRVAEWRSLRDHDALEFVDLALQANRESMFEKASINWLRKRVERIARERQAGDAPEPVYDYELRHGDLRTALDDLAGTVDVIVTDPPYAALEEIDALGELAARLLTEDGSLIVMVGHFHLPACLTRLSKHLVYRWMCAYVMDGPAARIHASRVGTKWKPLLVYDRGEHTRFITQDVYRSDRAEKDLAGQIDGWGQSESGMADIVDHLTEPGDLVVDPFMGAGTTGVACHALGRRFVGCDIDPDAVAVARRRLDG
jgi:hypothetical protein